MGDNSSMFKYADEVGGVRRPDGQWDAAAGSEVGLEGEELS